MTDPIQDARQPWEQLPDEPNRLFDRFEKFRLMGADRSLYRLYMTRRASTIDNSINTKKNDKPSNCPPSWRSAAVKWNWKKRAEDWDAFERERIRKEWEDRRAEIRTREWDAAKKLLDKASNMLDFPLAQTKREDTNGEDGKIIAVTTINPARWTMGDAGRLFDTASKLARLAAEMETSRDAVSVHNKSKSADEMTDDELAAIAAGTNNPTASGTSPDNTP